MRINNVNKDNLQIALDEKLLNPMQSVTVRHFLNGTEVKVIAEALMCSTTAVRDRLGAADRKAARLLRKREFEEKKQKMDQLSYLNLSDAVRNQLEFQGIDSTQKLLSLSESDLAKIENFGSYTINNIQNMLAKHGMKLSESDNPFFFAIKRSPRIPENEGYEVRAIASMNPTTRYFCFNRSYGNDDYDFTMVFDTLYGKLIDVRLRNKKAE